ncbi:MAG: pyridoxal phosphate-dependent aminotransferase [Gemmatimonadota bacterium]
MRFSSHVSSLEPSATLALRARARRLAAEGRSVVDLSAGEPTFPTPTFAAEAAVESIRAGRTGYPPTQGIPELRTAIADYLAGTTAHGALAPEDVLVSCGAKQALFNCVFSLIDAGEEVLVPAPFWPSYDPIVRFAGGRPVVVPTRWQEGFVVDPAALEAARTPATRALILNSPANPTGAVIPEERLSEIAAWCDRHGIWLLADEIYRRLSYGEGAAPSVLDLAPDVRGERIVMLGGVSKSFSMTGWRIGFAAGPGGLIARATALQSQTTSAAAGPSQYAAAAAYASREREPTIGEFVRILGERRRLGLELLGQVPGFRLVPPDGAIYLFPRVPDGVASAALAEGLLERAGVACVPGDAFGAPGFLRFNFAVREKELREGLERTRAYVLEASRG